MSETKTYTPAEQAEWRRKWCKALRSGRYKQCRGHWDTPKGKYCCLGVAGRVIRQKADEFISDKVRTAMGIKSNEPFIKMNDTDRLTFPQIADRIEQDPNLVVKEEGR